MTTTQDKTGPGWGRALAVIHGVASYLVFLASFVYAIGFVGDFLVPKTIDSGPTAPLATALIVDTLLLLLFAVPHSVMARPGFKRWWARFVPTAVERSTYVLVSSLLLGLLYWQWRPITSVVWRIEQPAGRWPILALFGTGWAIVLVSTFLIDHFDLFGLRQVFLYARGRAYAPPEFRTGGLYRHVRHPIMTGFLIAFWAAPMMTAGHLLFALATTAYVLIALRFEERDLIDYFGEPYRAYRERVGMLFPLPKAPRAMPKASRVE